MRVRIAIEPDEQSVLDVLRAAGDATGRQPSKARLARVRAKVRSPAALTLVADDAGAVVGVLLAELGRRDDGAGPVEPGLLHLSLLCVAPQHRRRGIGRALVRALVERFGHVSTWVPGGPGRDLLEREGFAPSGRTADAHGAQAAHLVHVPAP